MKVLLFHLSGPGNHHDDVALYFISDSSSCMLGLPNKISFVSGFFLEGDQNSQNVNQELRGCISFFRRLYTATMFILGQADFPVSRFGLYSPNYLS